VNGNRGEDGRFEEVSRTVRRLRAEGKRVDLADVIRLHPELRMDANLVCRIWQTIEPDAPTAASSAVGASRPDESEPGREVRSGGSGVLEPSVAPLLIRKEFNGFRILRYLGEGGMGRVFLAHEVTMNRLVAVKVLRPELSGNAAYKARFLQEIEAAARVRHPNLAQVYSNGEVDGIPFYTMEYVDGGSLEDVLEDLRESSHLITKCDLDTQAISPRQTQRRLIRAIADAARALDAIHQSGIVHRDVTPRNILLSNDGVVKVVDFGLARLEGREAISVSGCIPGTPLYLSPEALASRRVERRSDVFSLGVILYECLTGRSPWDDGPLEALYRQIALGDPVAPRRLNPCILRDIEAITLKAIERRPENRYATAADLAEDLDRFLGDRPVQARPSGFLRRSLRAARRRPVACLIALAVVAGTLGAAWWWFLLRPAQLFVSGTPNALLEVRLQDGSLAAVDSLPEKDGLSLRLPPGDYRLTAVHSGFKSGERSIQLHRGPNDSLRMDLAWERGFLALDDSGDPVKVEVRRTDCVPPGPRLLLDPASAEPVPLDCGRYTLTIQGDRTWRRTFEVDVEPERTSRVLAHAVPLNSAWTFSAGEGGVTSVVPVDPEGDAPGEILVATGARGVYLLDAETGEARAECHLRGMVHSPPLVLDTVTDGTIDVVAASWEEGIACFRMSRLDPIASLAAPVERRWLFPVDHDHRIKAGLVAAGAQGTGTAWIAAADDRECVYFLDAGGQLRLKARLPAGVEARDGLAVLESSVGSPACLLAGCKDGVLRWLDPGQSALPIFRELPCFETIVASLIVRDLDRDGVREIFAASLSGEVLRVSETGHVAWRLRLGGSRAGANAEDGPPAAPGFLAALSSADMDGDEVEEVFFAGADGLVRCVRSGGVLVWQKPLGAALSGGMAAGVLGPEKLPCVVLGARDQRLYALRARDGEILWIWKLDQPLQAAPLLSDVDGDAALDVLAGSGDGNVSAISCEVTAPAWTAKLREPPGELPQIVDMDGDGRRDVLIGSRDGALHCFGADGVRLWAFFTGGWVVSGPAVEDLDRDGRLECLIGSFDARVYCLRSIAGGVESLWKEGKDGLSVGSPVSARPLVVDLEGDGSLEVLVASWDLALHAFDARGARLWTTLAGTPSHEDDRIHALSAGDMDGDGVLEVAATGGRGAVHVFARDPDGSWRKRWGDRTKYISPMARARGERAELVILREPGIVAFLDATGKELRSWVARDAAKLLAASDLDGDGGVEVVLQDAGSRILCFERDGVARWALPLPPGGCHEPILCDFTGDGRNEILVSHVDGLGRVVDVATGEVLRTLMLSVPEGNGVAAGDLSGDGRPDVVISRADRRLACHHVPFP
jgi:serine/threonine protein kinase/outer membrane protein assembly factor BamB